MPGTRLGLQELPPATIGLGSAGMWNHAEVAGLLDRDGRVCLVSRNEQEAPVRKLLGMRAVDVVLDRFRQPVEDAVRDALAGNETHFILAGMADAGFVVWARARIMPSPLPEAPVMFHFRRLPKTWDLLSPRERDVVHALHAAFMNPKRAARNLGMSVHTLNAHRRSICQKCRLHTVGEFWVYVERCR
jgi:DNA-binding NarL/FixJ family response regulator